MFEDKTLVCKECGEEFVFTAREQEFYAEKGFMLVDIGHYSSEYGIVDVFANILSKNFPNFAVSISKRNNNPIYYY